MFPKSRYKFYSFQREKNVSLPKFIFPGVWFERKNQGLSVKMIRITAAFMSFRWHVYIGKTISPPNDPITSNVFELDGFVNWLNNWSGKKHHRSTFDSWLLQSDWKTLVRWGGTKYHYSKIVLAKEFLMDKEMQDTVDSDMLQTHDELHINLTMDGADKSHPSRKRDDK